MIEGMYICLQHILMMRCVTQEKLTIDKTDMFLSSVECLQKNMKWYKKLFFYLIDLGLLNSPVKLAKKSTKIGTNSSKAEFWYTISP